MLRLWDYLIELLKGRRSRLDLSVEVQRIFQEMLLLLDSMEETKVCSLDSAKDIVQTLLVALIY